MKTSEVHTLLALLFTGGLFLIALLTYISNN